MVRKNFDLSEYQIEQSAKKLKLINEFVTTELMVSKDYKRGGRTVKILDDSDNGIDGGRLGDYLSAHDRARKRGIINNCFDIAKRAVDEDCATGRIAAHDGTSNFVGWGNHCICYDELDDGRCVAVDLTASSNIDEGIGNFDVLAITAIDLNQLLSRVGKLFGGEWVVMQDD
jgi:hypothetical protein